MAGVGGPDDAGFERYRVSMFRRRRPRLPLPKMGWSVPLGPDSTYLVFSMRPVEGVGTEVRVNERRIFIGDMLRAHFGTAWPEVLAKELEPARRRFLRIDGEDAAGKWHRLPTGQPATVSGDSVRGRTPGLGMDTFVRHLRDREGMKGYDSILRMLEASGDAWAGNWLDGAGTQSGDRGYQTDRLRRAYSNGKTVHSQSCSYCQTGLPEPWMGLVATYK
ncbi:MAG: hypothetical protein CVU47_04620 [Chloroflexi bacterium HGW-Chloroflexi-9]|nr:MAG: hypothetical protein CVU47_04620 [Chloroflexi bacterium HGW-Chloroflexi-9]